ncbi:MAG: MBL fold metallo-hydrolase [Candidatus Thorarchaeota archaeon]|nr:MBL fold metallo-hydrolase [Candidatus Thorarchaeota archaeon]
MTPRYPVTGIKTMDGFFESIEADTEKLRQGKRIASHSGLFGESHEIALFELARTRTTSSLPLPIAAKVSATLDSYMLDSADTFDEGLYKDALAMCLYGHLLGNYTDEDFRYLYRYSLWKSQVSESTDDWMRKALVILSAVCGPSPREIMSEVRRWIDYLGTPLWQPARFVDVCAALGIDIGPLLVEEDYRLTDTLQRRSAYLYEAAQGKKYYDVRSATREWLPEVLSSRLFSEFQRAVYAQAQQLVSDADDVRAAFRKVSDYFAECDFRTHPDDILPVRLQQLARPPSPDIVDHVVFEMVPQKMRVQLMPSIVYSTRTKKVEIILLGGQEIGRSAVLVKTSSGGILMDFGLSVANQSTPLWEPEVNLIDTVLVTHSHLDHVGGLPVLYEEFTGKWCSVAPTGAVAMTLLEDALNVGTPLPPRKNDPTDMVSRFTKENIQRVAKNHVNLEVGKSSEVAAGVVVTPIQASHIPGSVAYLVDIEGLKILYTGDFNLDDSLLFPGAQMPTESDVTIFDGTYWGREDFDRQRAAALFDDVTRNNGPVIIPSFAVGRTQEVLTMLEKTGITSRRNVMVAGMAETITKMTGYQGSWSGMKKNKTWLDRDDVLVTGGGMMAGGLARQFFNEHRDNKEAAVVLCGYLAPRTPGWNLLHGYEKHQCRVEYARLSAHSSSTRLQEWVRSCTGIKVMVHTPERTPPDGVTVPSQGQRITLSV